MRTLIMARQSYCNHYILEIIIRKLRKSGVFVMMLPLPDRDEDMANISQEDIKKRIKMSEADFIFGINLSVLENFTEGLYDSGKPIVTWFMDNPLIDLSGRLDFERHIFFVIDRMQKKLIEDEWDAPAVHYLPLATDESIFNYNENQYRYYHDEISFAATLPDTEEFSELMTQGAIAESRQKIFRETADRLFSEKGTTAETLLQETAPEFIANIGRGTLHNLAYIMNNEVTRRRRVEMIGAVKSEVAIFGGNDWKKYLKPNALYKCNAPYQSLKNIYFKSKINLNQTNMHTPAGANHRLFDVPAAGGFLLTDERDDVSELFETGKEVMTYSSFDDLNEKINYYINRERARDEIAAAARRKIYSQHTYSIRVKQILEVVEAELGRG